MNASPHDVHALCKAVEIEQADIRYPLSLMLVAKHGFVPPVLQFPGVLHHIEAVIPFTSRVQSPGYPVWAAAHCAATRQYEWIHPQLCGI